MFANFFKPKWQHARADVRLSAIELFDVANSEQRDILIQLAEHDPDIAVRQTILIKFSDMAWVKSRAEKDSSSDVRATAQHHFEQLLAGQITPGPSQSQRLEMLALQTDKSLLNYIVNHADEALAEAALARLDDSTMLEQVALHHPLAKLRVVATQRIDAPAALQHIAKASKGKNKRLYQLSRTKLAKIRAEIEQRETQNNQAIELCQGMEALAKAEFSALYEPRLKGLLRQWKQLSLSPDAALLQRFEQAHQDCLSTLKKHANKLAELEAQTLLQAEIDGCCLALEEQVNRSKNHDDLDDNTLASLGELLEQQHTRWQKLADETKIEPLDAKRFNAARSALLQYQTAAQTLLEHEQTLASYSKQQFDLPQDAALMIKAAKHIKQLINDIHWPDSFKQAKPLLEAQKTLATLQKKQHEIKGWEKQQTAELKNILSRLEAAIDDGILKQAERYFSQAQNLFNTLPRQDTARLQTQFTHLKARVHELRDWRGFGNVQQKEALCQRMEALIDEDLPPQERADMVKQLQTEWKASGSAAQHLSEALWQRFKQASDAAYEPCHAYFQQQGEIRKDNLIQRQKICEQLESFFQQTDWQQVDWKALDKIIETAKKEWRQYSPVERKPGKDVHLRFDTVLKALKNKLKEEQRRNLEHKRILIKRAEALLDHDNIAEAIELAIQLQSEWRNIGVTQHKQNTQAWKKFRSACDAIFAQRDQQRQQQRDAQEKTKLQAEVICQTIDSLAQLSDEDLAASRNEYQAAVAEFNGLDKLPKKIANNIQQRFEKTCQHYERQLKTLPQRKRHKQLKIMLQQTELCQQLEQLSLQAPPASRADIEAIKQQWPSDTSNSATSKFLSTRWNKALDVLSAGQQFKTNKNNDAALALLCVRMEILADLPSPDDAKTLRMEYQLSQLNESMSQREQTPTIDQAYSLVSDWCQVGVVDRDLFSTANIRFSKALKMCVK